MLTINTNLSSLIAQRSMKSSTNKLNQAIERMTTGFKINHAKDNAANYSIATNMTTKIGAYNVAEDNAAMGLDLISTAEGTLSQIEDKLQRLRALAEQASNGTYGEQSLNAINAEANALVDEINRLYSTAEYNGIKLFDQETQIPDDPNIPKAQYDGFIKEVVKRDTSTMTTLASVDESADLADGTYSISTPEEMKKLADMTNAGLVSAGDEFVLANNIDLSQYENWTPIGDVMYDNGWIGIWFKGVFDGNGFVVKNVTCNTEGTAGLFGGINDNAEIKNIGVVDSVFEGRWCATLLRISSFSNVTNVFSANCQVKSIDAAAGILVELYNSSISNSYASGNIIIGDAVGGIAFQNGWDSIIENCYSCNEASGLTKAGGLVAYLTGTELKIKNSYVFGNSNLTGIFIGSAAEEQASCYATIEDSGYSNYYSGKPLVGNSYGGDVITNVNALNLNNEKLLNLQVGINAKNSSNISVNTSFLKEGTSLFRLLGKLEGDFITHCDRLLGELSEKQTHFGATSNRLESVLEEITIQRDNLVSSRSTIRDADIAEVSSHYIQQQILQQASATLLATANQSPSIALQLI